MSLLQIIAIATLMFAGAAALSFLGMLLRMGLTLHLFRKELRTRAQQVQGTPKPSPDRSEPQGSNQHNESMGVVKRPRTGGEEGYPEARDNVVFLYVANEEKE